MRLWSLRFRQIFNAVTAKKAINFDAISTILSKGMLLSGYVRLTNGI